MASDELAQEIAKGLSLAPRMFLLNAHEPNVFGEDDGPQRGADQAEREGLAWTSCWKGGWMYGLTDLGLAVRDHLANPTPGMTKE